MNVLGCHHYPWGVWRWSSSKRWQTLGRGPSVRCK